MEHLFIGVALILVGAIFVAMYRGAIGPMCADRIVAINLIGTKAVVIVSLIAFAHGEKFFLDVSLVYSLIAFLMTVAMAKYLEIGRLD